MALSLDGRQLAAELEQRLSALIAANLQKAGRPPGLAVLRVGEDPASGVYVANKEKACLRVGIRNLGAHLPVDTTPDQVLAVIRRLNEDPEVDGILLQLPFPPACPRRACWRRLIRRRTPMGSTVSTSVVCSRGSPVLAVAPQPG